MMKTHFKNVLACALTVFLFTLILGGIGLKTALAVTDVWDGSTASAFAEGDGTSDNPYQIATGEQLAYLASVVNGSANGEISLGVYYVLTADIDLNHLSWTPIATTYFRGTFDGDGHVISNLSIGSAAVPDTSGKSLGLFGTVAGGTVKNLGIENIAIYASASSRTGGVAGSFSSWGTPMTPTTIFNCYTSGVIVNSRAGSAAYAGGLAGTCSGVSEDEGLKNLVINCGSTVNVTASGTATTVRAGGLLGLTSLANIRNCYAAGDVVSGNIDKTGGLIGDNQSASVTTCYWNSDAQQIISGSVNQVPKLGIGYLYTGLTDTTTPKTSSQMKDSAFVTLLNDNRESYAMWGFVSGANNGYPVLLLSAPVISLTPSGNKTFSPQVVGYGAQTPYSVTINNTGSAETGALTIALSGTDASSFALSASSITTIAAGASSSFTVAPNTGLLEGTYNATVTVSGDAVTSQTFDVQFTVQAATYSISADPSSLAFGSDIEGYAAPSAQTVTITNDGNSTVTLSLPTVTDYTLTALSATTLASGASATFTVQPKTDLGVGDHNATITVSTNHGTSADVSATFTVEAATYSISADPSSLAFGSDIEGYAAPSAQTVTITNDGNSTVTLSLPTVTDYTLTALSATTLASGASATFTVQPKTDLGVGDHNATITVSSNHGTSADVSATFTVEAATYSISADPSSLAFGSAIEGYAAPSAQTVTITNDGNSTVTLSLPTVTDYTLTALSATTLASGESATFTVQPKIDLGVGDHNATITVSTNHGTGADVSATFTVTSATYGISVSPTSLAFGSAVEGYAAPSAQTVTITNDGNSTVTLSLPTVTDYTLTALSASTLASGASATFTVRPDTDLGIGDHNATITVSTNHSTSADVSATFTVTSATYGISVSPTSLAFGSAVEGYAAPTAKTVTVTNDGNSTVTLSLPTVTDYTLTALSASTLASGDSATFTVQPKTDLGVGDHNATITVSTNHGTSADVSATFTVTSATYGISVSPSSLAFGSAIEGYAAPSAQTVTVTNDGNSTVSLSLPTVTDYTLTALSATTLASGASATFTVQPKTDLGIGDHNATITVSTNHGTSADVSATFAVEAATYSISVDPTRKDFGSITEGDSTPAAVTVTVTNIGNSPVTLSQPTATHYTISALSTTDIASAATATFTIAPASGLGAGEYNETIDITGSNGASAQLEVLFTVNEAPRYEITADPVSVTFPTLAKGYLPPDAQTVTITNTGNQNITLSQPTATNYTFGDLSASALAPTDTATFTIMPKSGLDVGVWDYTLHVQGSYDVDASVNIAFTCTVPHVYTILNGNGSTYQRNDPSSPLVVMTGDGEFETFTGLTINGELVSDGNYDKASGSTIITLHRDYLDNLRAGTYTMRIHHTDGYAEGRFVVYDAMPITGDNSTILIFGITTALCLITLVLMKRKRAR